MPTEEDLRILRHAVEQEFATQKQVDVLLRDLAAIEELGGQVTVAELMVKKKLCTAEELEILQQATIFPTPEPEADSSPARPAPSTPMAASGTKALAGFEIIERIGRGGMGAVFKARQISMQRIVALKVLSPKLVENQAYVERFLREARAAARLDHPNIVRGIDAGHDQGYYYLAMEFVEGETLRKQLKRVGKLDEPAALNITIQIASALQHAHESGGIVHRDVKPDNILLTPDGTTKLADLGLAKSVEDDAGLTRIGSAIGTPHYLSPEQARGAQELDSRTDIYSLGATLYHMLTGSPVFEGQTAAVVLSKHVNEMPVPPIEKNPGISSHANTILLKMLEKDPEDRYDTPAELIEDIRSALGGEELAHAGKAALFSTRLFPPVRNRSRKPAGVLPYILGGAAVALALIVLAAVLLHNFPRGNGLDPVLNQPKPPVAILPDPVDGGTDEGIDESPEVIVAAPEGPTPEEERSARAASELERAIQFAAQNPEQFAPIVAAFDSTANDYPGTPAAMRAASLVKEWQSKWAEAAKKELAKLSTQVDKALAQKDYLGALRLIDAFPKALDHQLAGRRRLELRRLVNRSANKAYRNFRARAEELAREKKFDEALQVLSGASAIGIDTIVEATKRLEATILAQKQEHEASSLQAATALLQKLDAALIEAFASRDHALASQLATQDAANADAARLQGEFEKRAIFTNALNDFWQKLDEGADALIGEKMVVMGRTGEVISVKNGRAIVDLGNVEAPLDLKTLPAGDLARLASNACDPNAPQDHCSLAAFWIAEKLPRRATQELDRAKALEADVEPYMAMLNAIEANAARETDEGATSEEDAIDSKTAAKLDEIAAQAERFEERGLFADAVEQWLAFAEQSIPAERLKDMLPHVQRLPVTIRFDPADVMSNGLSLPKLAGGNPLTPADVFGKHGIKLGSHRGVTVLQLQLDRDYAPETMEYIEIGIEVQGKPRSTLAVGIASVTQPPGKDKPNPRSKREDKWKTLVLRDNEWNVLTVEAFDLILPKANLLRGDILISGRDVVIRSVWVRINDAGASPLHKTISARIAQLEQQ